MAVARQAGAAVQVIEYMKTPLDRAQLTSIVDMLEDEVEDLVRKDDRFNALGLVATDYVGNSSAVVDILLQHGELMQRPVLVRGERAIIGRPQDRIEDFVS